MRNAKEHNYWGSKEITEFVNEAKKNGVVSLQDLDSYPGGHYIVNKLYKEEFKQLKEQLFPKTISPLHWSEEQVVEFIEKAIENGCRNIGELKNIPQGQPVAKRANELGINMSELFSKFLPGKMNKEELFEAADKLLEENGYKRGEIEVRIFRKLKGSAGIYMRMGELDCVGEYFDINTVRYSNITPHVVEFLKNPDIISSPSAVLAILCQSRYPVINKIFRKLSKTDPDSVERMETISESIESLADDMGVELENDPMDDEIETITAEDEMLEDATWEQETQPDEVNFSEEADKVERQVKAIDKLLKNLPDLDGNRGEIIESITNIMVNKIMCMWLDYNDEYVEKYM